MLRLDPVQSQPWCALMLREPHSGTLCTSHSWVDLFTSLKSPVALLSLLDTSRRPHNCIYWQRHHFHFTTYQFEIRDDDLINAMPALVHLARRFLESGTTEGISATAIGLIVGLGIVPVIILIWVVSWLFWCYPYDRSCCCTRRKKKQADVEASEQMTTNIASQTMYHEKANYHAPERPTPNYRTESGNSNGGNRLTKTDPRISLQTIASNNTIHVAHEPKPFV
jgi:hypothetical protein